LKSPEVRYPSKPGGLMFFCPTVYVEPMPLGLSDSQLAALMASAGPKN